MLKQECKNCKRRFKILVDDLCYFCFIKIYGKPPNSGPYKIEK
jgi:hypothetical protein